MIEFLKKNQQKRYKSEVEVKTKKKIPNNWWLEHLLLRKVFKEGINIQKKEEYLQDSGKREEKVAVIEWKRYKLWALSNPTHFIQCLKTQQHAYRTQKWDKCLDERAAGIFWNILINRIRYWAHPNSKVALFGELFPTMVQTPESGVRYCSEPYLTSQLTQGAILHPPCKVGCGRSCWDGRCELFGQASPEPASLWERGSQSQAALLPSKT